MNLKTLPADWEEIRQRCTPDKIGFVAMMMPRRIGAYAFVAFLEHRHFSPVPAPREDFELFQVAWEGCGFLILLVPGSARPLADGIARELGLRFADGVPCVMTSAGNSFFPVQGPNLFTVENIPGHFVYRNNPAENKTAEDYENEAVDRVVAESVKKFRQWQNENPARVSGE